MEYFLHLPPQYISIIQLVYIYRASKKNLRRKLNVFSAGEKTNKLTPEKSNKASSEDILHFRTSVFLPASLRGDQQNHHFHYHDQVQSGKICGRRSCWLVVEVAKQKTKLLKYWLLGSRTVAANAKAAWDFLSVALTMTFWWFSCVFSNCRLINAFSLVFVLTEEPFPFY